MAGLKKGGVLILQSNREEADLWASFPLWMQKQIVDNDIRVFYLDAFQIAREEAGSADLQLRMQGIAFQGAFFAASPVMKNADLSEEKLFKAIEDQLQAKFGDKGKRVVDDNLRVVRRGYSELKEIREKSVGATRRNLAEKTAGMPIMLKQLPEGDGRVADIHRFWEQTGSFYAGGKGSDNLVDPFIGASLVPAATGVFRDMTQIRFEYPEWIAENCTACGNCYTECPDSAIPGLVSTVADIFSTAVTRVERGGRPTRFLRRAVRTLEKKLRGMIEGDGVSVRPLIDDAINATIAEAPEAEREKLAEEFGLFRESIGDFQFGTTKPYWTQKEKKGKGSGGLFSITINPYTCKACALCVKVCEDDALRMVTQTEESIERLRSDWNFWLDLPTTPPEYSRIDSLDEKIGALETLLLDKRNYGSMPCGDGACLGCGEKTAIHLFTGTVTALMQPRVEQHVAHLDDLIARLEKHIRMKLTESVDLSDTVAVLQAVNAAKGEDLTLASLSAKIMENKPSRPLDPAWVKWATQLIEKLKDLKWRYVEGPTKRGRAEMGIINSTGCTSVWGSTYPFHPYPFPWTSHLFQDSPSVAMGIFEGHMAKMAEGFKAVRMAELELANEYTAEKHEDFFRRFTWQQFSEDEWLLCPPVVSIGGDGAMYDIGFQNLSRADVRHADQGAGGGHAGVFQHRRPGLHLGLHQPGVRHGAVRRGPARQTGDAQGNQPDRHGAPHVLRDVGHHRPYQPPHRELHRRPQFAAAGAVQHLCRLSAGARHRRRQERGPEQAGGRGARLSVVPLRSGCGRDLLGVRQPGGQPGARAGLAGPHPEVHRRGRRRAENGTADDLRRLRRDGRGVSPSSSGKAPPETWNDDMVPMADFLALDKGEREGKFPFIWAVDKKNRLMRLLATDDLVRATEERLHFWQQLKNIAGLDKAAVDTEMLADQVRAELLAKITASLGVAGGVASAAGASQPQAAQSAAPAADGYEPVWVETPECTACDECTTLAPKVFVPTTRSRRSW
ncbi:MAG: 2-oxoacid:acceptor oxidoreductase family protein [Rhodocyclaceae bacterium]|nr:2-oxoacid:acceptor oxidoreductase family protein [Rhodocyclaceae bacterium]